MLAGEGVAPLEAAEFADADAGDVEELEDDAVAALGGGVDESGDFTFGEDALGEGVAIGLEFDGDADIIRKIAGLLGEGEERLDGGEGAVAGGGLEGQLGEVGGPGLQVGEGDGGEGLVDEGEEVGGVGGVGAAGVAAGFEGEPEGEELRVGVRRRGRGRSGGEAPGRCW